MTLCEAHDAFEENKSVETATAYLHTALEYYEDEIIGEITMKHIEAKCREYVEHLA